MILVTFALRQEGVVFEQRLKRKRVKNGVTTGLIHEQPVAIFWLGVGFVNPDRFQAVVNELQPDLIINAGFAGAVRPELQPGDFLLGENVSSLALMQRLRGTSLFDAIGIFYEVDKIINPAEKCRLLEQGNLLAANMESDRVAIICRTFPFPFVTARMVSDRFDEAIPGLFIGKGIRRFSDIFDAAQFAVRMLGLRKKFADRLETLIEEGRKIAEESRNQNSE